MRSAEPHNVLWRIVAAQPSKSYFVLYWGRIFQDCTEWTGCNILPISFNKCDSNIPIMKPDNNTNPQRGYSWCYWKQAKNIAVHLYCLTISGRRRSMLRPSGRCRGRWWTGRRSWAPPRSPPPPRRWCPGWGRPPPPPPCAPRGTAWILTLAVYGEKVFTKCCFSKMPVWPMPHCRRRRHLKTMNWLIRYLPVAFALWMMEESSTVDILWLWYSWFSWWFGVEWWHWKIEH